MIDWFCLPEATHIYALMMCPHDIYTPTTYVLLMKMGYFVVLLI